MTTNISRRLLAVATGFLATAILATAPARADEAAAKKWIDKEFQPSTLNKQQQLAELQWFIKAAAQLKARGVKEISVVSETINTHSYESKQLAQAFTEITGIKVRHDPSKSQRGNTVARGSTHSHVARRELHFRSGAMQQLLASL